MTQLKMCGICVYFGVSHPSKSFNLASLKHRGPDTTDCQTYGAGNSSTGGTCIFGFQRLAIIDPTPDGMQPMSLGNVHLVCNGEIYNYKQLIKKYNLKPPSESDCAVLLSLYHHHGGGIDAIKVICDEIDAEFCFAIYDEDRDELYVGRDFGIRPLFYAHDDDGFFFASEAKALIDTGLVIKPFPPRSYWSMKTSFVEYHPLVVKTACLYDQNQKVLTDYSSAIRETFEKAVIDRLHADRPIGFFLSGGLDSSLVVAIATRHLKNKQEVHTFSIGIAENSPDLVAARKVSQFLGTHHHEVIFSPEEAFKKLPKLIATLETFDTTTIRASMPQYLLAEYISQQTDIKVLLSGEGSDELAFGYLMFSLASTSQDAQQVSIELLRDLYMYDCLRCDRSTACWGLEVRVPFLSWAFVDLLISIPPAEKMMKDGPFGKIEKHLIRQAFAGDYLPEDILWRGKAAFSDAVGLGWVDYLKSTTESLISEEYFQSKHYDHCPPRTREELYYREIYERSYPGQKLLNEFWYHRWQETNDPSARTLNNYREF